MAEVQHTHTDVHRRDEMKNTNKVSILLALIVGLVLFAGTHHSYAASEQMLTVTGLGGPTIDPSLPVPQRRMKAERDARLDGAGKLSVALRAMVTDGGETIEQVMARDEQMRQRLETFIQGAKATATRFFPDGRVEVDIALDLTALPSILQANP
jgi:hypothetical protein